MKKYKPVIYKGAVIKIEIHNNTVYQTVETKNGGFSIPSLSSVYQKGERFILKEFIKDIKEDIDEILKKESLTNAQ